MKNELIKAFTNDKFGNVRVVLIGVNQEPYFVGKDVAISLGYKDTSDAVKKHVDEEDKLTRQIADSGQNRNMICINESGLYSLILGSKLPSAKEFKRWVTSEVLPSIRQTGGYGNPYGHLSKELQAIIIVDQKQQELENRVDRLEDNMPLFNCECKELQARVKKVGINILGGYKSKAYTDNSLRGKVYSDIHIQIKREFGVSMYQAIKRSQFEKAKEIVEQYKAPIVLSEEIDSINNQISFYN